MSENVICFDENPQRQNVEEDRRGYGGRFEERGCGGAGQNAPIKKCIRRGASVIVFIREVVYR